MPLLIKAVKEAGIMLISSGKLNSDPDNIRLQVEQGVDGIVLNRRFKYHSQKA